MTDEDATVVLAGAGSGKTREVVAKAADLVERGIRHPVEILLLAFGKYAVSELAERIAIEIGEPGIAERHYPSRASRMLAQTA